MNTLTVLDEAERRLPAEADRRRTLHREIVDGMRTEIGVNHYQEAKEQLPKLEEFITKHARPYLDRMVRLSHGATVPLPSYILAYVRELETTCATGTDWVRAGVGDWDRLAPPLIPDTQQIDHNRRAGEVDSIRRRLMNWNGKESRLRDLMTHINNYLKDSNWPVSPPTVPGTAA
jgi:hypothetical protein